MHRLLLHARRLAFTHPESGARMQFEAPLDREFQRVIDEFGWADSGF